MPRQPRPESVVMVISEQAEKHQSTDVQDPAPQRHAALTQALAGAVGRPLTRCTGLPGTAGVTEIRRAITTARDTLITYTAGGILRTEAGHLALRSSTELAKPAQTLRLNGLAEAVNQATALRKLQIHDLRAGPDLWSSVAEEPEFLGLSGPSTAVIGHLRVANHEGHSITHSHTWTELLTCILRDGVRGTGPEMTLEALAKSFPQVRSLSSDHSQIRVRSGKNWLPMANRASVTSRSLSGTPRSNFQPQSPD